MLRFLPETDPFEWQKECLKRWLKNHRRGIVNVATGAGKTVLALAAIYNSEKSDGPRGKLKIKIVVPKIFLASQWLNAIKDELSIPREEIGLYNGVVKDDINRKYMIYVLNSARNCLSRHILSDFEKGYRVLLICDECHHMGSIENRKIFDFLSLTGKTDGKYFSLGLSATPETDAYQEVLVPALGKEIYQYNLVKATEAKIIAEYNVFNVAFDFTPEESAEYETLSLRLSKILISLKSKVPSLRNQRGAQFYLKLQSLSKLSGNSEVSALAQYALSLFSKRKEIVHNSLSRFECAYELICRLGNDNKIIVFGERIETADALYEKLRRAFSGKVGKYHSEMGDNAKRNVLYAFQNSEITILVCCKALDEGLNIPDTDVAIIMSSTNSIRQRIQRLGRVLRKIESRKAKAIYYLHIPSSSEENEIIPKSLHKSLIETQLYYNYKEKEFHNPHYDTLTAKLRKRLLSAHISHAMIEEVDRNLQLGSVRLDYRSSAEQCAENIRNAEDIEMRNYWITMSKLIVAEYC